jgi:hypothetical protein
MVIATAPRSPASALRERTSATPGAARAARASAPPNSNQRETPVRASEARAPSALPSVVTSGVTLHAGWGVDRGALVEQADQMRSRVHIEREQYGRHIILDRAERELRRPADLLIAAAFEDQLQDLEVSWAKFSDAIVV